MSIPLFILASFFLSFTSDTYQVHAREERKLILPVVKSTHANTQAVYRILPFGTLNPIDRRWMQSPTTCIRFTHPVRVVVGLVKPSKAGFRVVMDLNLK